MPKLSESAMQNLKNIESDNRNRSLQSHSTDGNKKIDIREYLSDE